MARRADPKETELRLDAKITEAKAEILKWMFGQTILPMGVLIAFLRLGR